MVEVAVPAGRGDLSDSERRRLLMALAITETVGYGVLYYAFSVFLIPVSLTLHTSATVVTGALTIGVVVTGLAAIPVGRWIDRNGAYGFITGGGLGRQNGGLRQGCLSSGKAPADPLIEHPTSESGRAAGPRVVVRHTARRH